MADMTAEEYLCTRIRRAEQALMAHHEAALRTYGLTMTQYTVLLTLSRDDGMSGAQLARACGVTQQSMATVLTGMQAKGLIDRQPSPVHAKVMIATLTDTGQRHLNGAYQEVNALEKAFIDTFTPVEHRQFCDLLDRATETLIEQTPRPAKSPSPRPPST
ncbi:MarR family winged helix-turn-helix transcriptional regulator [Nonomuraea sp. 10N515B]|uniref:MarR family winged helix-turn-helix transcriptional regulator n=1 Tax=Nonomuraea sp. 10N515B TaxID=3457422 RepID=UPI003FCDCA3B